VELQKGHITEWNDEVTGEIYYKIVWNDGEVIDHLGAADLDEAVNVIEED